MKKLYLSALILFFGMVNISAQDLGAVEFSFDTGPLETKVGIINTLPTSEEYNPILIQSLDFIKTNEDDLQTIGMMRTLSLSTFHQITKRSYEDAALALWEVINTDIYDIVSIEAMECLKNVGKENKQVRLFMREWLTIQNGLFMNNNHVNKQMIAEMINTLEYFSDGESFKIILESLNLNISFYVNRAAKQALKTLTPIYLVKMEALLISASINEREAAIDTILSSNLKSEDKAVLLSTALNGTLEFIPTNKNQTTRNKALRQKLTRELIVLESPEATLVCIRNLEKGIAEYERGEETRFFLIEIIDSLASTGTEVAAVELSDYLNHLNSLQESGDKVDEKLYIAVIKTLGELGDSIAMDPLSYTKHLQITATINAYTDRALRKIK